jgi:hypothetical protein
MPSPHGRLKAGPPAGHCSAAEFAAQFGGLCYGPRARYRCVAATWQNFHPDLPDAPLAELSFQLTLDRLALTMKAAGLVDTTCAIPPRSHAACGHDVLIPPHPTPRDDVIPPHLSCRVMTSSRPIYHAA